MSDLSKFDVFEYETVCYVYRSVVAENPSMAIEVVNGDHDYFREPAEPGDPGDLDSYMVDPIDPATGEPDYNATQNFTGRGMLIQPDETPDIHNMIERYRALKQKIRDALDALDADDPENEISTEEFIDRISEAIS